MSMAASPVAQEEELCERFGVISQRLGQAERLLGLSQEETLVRNAFSQEPLNWLPRWACDRRVAALAGERYADNHDRLRPTEVAGGAVLWSHASTIFVWSFFFGFTALSWLTTPVARTRVEHFAVCPPWLYCLAVPLIVINFLFQWKILTFILVPQVQYTGGATVIGVPLPFHCWLALMSIISAVTTFDLVTYGIFFAKMVRTLDAPIGSDIQRIWAFTIKESVMAQLAIFGDFNALVWIVWCLLLVQLLYALAASVPLEPARVHYSLEEEGREWKGYRVLLYRTWHIDVVTRLAQANRMPAILFKNFDQQMARAVERLDHIEHNATDYLQRLCVQLEQLVVRFLLYSILENAFRLEFQVTCVAIGRALAPPKDKDVDYQTLLSILVSSVMSIYTAVVAAVAFRSCLGYWWRCDASTVEENETPVFPGGGTALYYSLRIRRLLIVFASCIAMYVCIIVHTWAKLAMAFTCKYSVWNFTDSGCVDLSGIVGY